jgi:hypothetical protein
MEAAGGAILRDLFTEDRGGWFEDVALLERLALKKIAAEAECIREAGGWKWAKAFLDCPLCSPAQVDRGACQRRRRASLEARRCERQARLRSAPRPRRR